MKDNANFWNRMAKNYDSRVSKKYSRAYESTISLSRGLLRNKDTVLDYGCGTGITTIELAGRVRKIHAIDTAQSMIRVASAKKEEKGLDNIEFLIGDIFDQRLEEEYFDAVTAFNVLHFQEDIDAVVKRIYRLLKPGGLLLSATDILGEKKTTTVMLMGILSKIGILPRFRSITVAELTDHLVSNKFSIEDSHRLHNKPLNLFLSARKI